LVRRIAASGRFSSRRHSISEIADAVINVVPGQGSETVRKEEAENTALALINIAVED
jgi:predicted SPOUT superfamily RNA methylase MTH1